MYFNELFTIGAVLLLGCMSPGPDFVAVTSQALGTRRAGLRVALGIATAITCWAALSVFGLTVILARIAWLYELVRWVGAAYLIWIGAQLLLAAVRHGDDGDDKGPVTRAAAPAGVRRGFVLGITNPKSAVFFSSLFATLLPATAPAWVYTAVVGLAAATAFGWFALIAVAFSTPRVQAVYRRLQRAIDGLAGGLLTLIGLRLAFTD